MLASILCHHDRDVAQVDDRAAALGTDPSLVRDLLPVVDPALRPLADRVPALLPPVDERPIGVREVPDVLGLIYGMATLVGVGRLIEAAAAQPPLTAPTTASTTRSTSASVIPDPLGRHTPRA